MSVFNRDLVVQLLNKLLGKADLAIGKTDEVLGDTKKILTAVSGGTGAVKSVQRGMCHFGGASQSGGNIFRREIKINHVNPKKTVVIINNAWKDYNVALISLTSDTLTLGTRSYITDETNDVSWQVVEFY